MNRFIHLLKALIGPAIIIVAVVAIWFYRAELLGGKQADVTQSASKADKSTEKQTVLEISEQARKNLPLVSTLCAANRLPV